MANFSTSVVINSGPAEVWKSLTSHELISQWMAEPEMNFKISTDWTINSPILIEGVHHAKFENKGIVLQYEKERKLSYSHLSSLSRLPDKVENYSILEFTLASAGERTILTLDISNFPTEADRKHLEFYWKTTVIILKNRIEQNQPALN